MIKNIFTDYSSIMVFIISELDPYLEIHTYTHTHTLKMDCRLKCIPKTLKLPSLMRYQKEWFIKEQID